jgi:hypothetical protein
VSRDSATARLFYLSLFFFPKEEREKNPLFSLSERTRAPEILLVVFLSRRWCLSPSLSLVAARFVRDLFSSSSGGARAQFFYLSFKGASMGKM